MNGRRSSPAGTHADGILAQSVGGGGGDAGMAISGGIGVGTQAGFSLGGSGGAGGNAGTVTVVNAR